MASKPFWLFASSLKVGGIEEIESILTLKPPNNEYKILNKIKLIYACQV